MEYVVEVPIPARAKARRRRRKRRRSGQAQGATSEAHAQAGQAKGGEGKAQTANGSAERESGQASGPPVDPWAAALGRALAVLDRADRFQVWLDKKPGRSQADLARKEKVTRARVSQIMRLRCLSDRIIEDLRRAERAGPVPGEADLRKVAGLPRGEQWARYEEVLRERGTGKRARAARPRGDLRFDFERARCWRAELEADDNLRLADIARREGYTPSRVSQIMNLLDLAPAIIELLDVEPSKKPKVLRKDIRRISWIQDHEEQMVEFEKLCRRSLPGQWEPPLYTGLLEEP